MKPLARRNRSAPFAALLLLTALTALAQDRAGPGAAIRAALAEAERHLAEGEPQIAESDYRGALLEARHLLGLLAVAEGDLPAARDALERSAASAAVGVLAPRIDLALVLHRLGETAEARQRLRALSRQYRPKAVVWQTLIATLLADGRRGEVAEQLEELRLVLPAIAAEIEARLAGLEDSEQAREAQRPRIDLSRLGPSGERREQLGRAATSAVAQAHSGLARARAQAIGPHAGGQTHLEALLDAVSSAPRGDLSGDEPPVQAVEAIRKGQLRKAVGFLLRAQKQGYGSPEVSELLAVVREATGTGVRARLELAQIAGRGGSPKAALELLAEARQRAPSCEQVLAAHARIAMSAGLTAVALQTLEPLAGIFPEVAEYSYLLGTARVRLGSMTDAVEALKRSVELAPEQTSYRAALAEALNTEKRFDEAEAHLIRVLEQTPENLTAVAALAQAEEGLGKLESAERRALSVLAFVPPVPPVPPEGGKRNIPPEGGKRNVPPEGGKLPEHATAHLVIGMVRMKQERYAEAREALEKTLAADPEATKAHYQLSLACMRLGDRESARRHLDLYNTALDNTEGMISLLHLESGTLPAGEPAASKENHR